MKYQCVSCGKVITEVEYLSDIQNGSSGMCFCEFTPDCRILNRYVLIEEGDE